MEYGSERSGTTQRAALRAVLTELVKAALVSNENFVAECRARGRVAQAGLHDPPQASEGIWELAVQDAERDPETQRLADTNPTLPTACPIDIAALAGRNFDFDGLAREIRQASSFG